MSDSGTLCSNLIRDVLSVYISEMLDDGTIKGIVDDYSKSTKTNTCSDGGSTSDNNKSNGGGSGGSSSNSNSNSNVDNNSGGAGSATQSLSLWDLGGLFIIVYLVWILASILAMMNWYLRKRNRKRNRQQDNNNDDDIGRTADGDEDGNVATDTSSMFSNHNDSTIDHSRQKQQQLRFQPDGIKNNNNINLFNNSIQKDDTESSMNNNTNNQNTHTHTNFTPSERDQLAFQLDSMRQQMEEMQTLLLLKVPVQKK